MSGKYVFTGPVKGKGCGNCKHIYPGRLYTTCAAFPDGIPPMFVNNEEFHGKPFPGDHGIQWEERPVIPSIEERIAALEAEDAAGGR